ncbi:MAG: hypothetical protein H0T89_35665 [Deltaproteobacteria bacterium]|nr:hypothetical protein [Deltaproteobacteria bacterium]MDQ3296579.1 hypothetical protein [Myxococcota bacterium]
MRIRTLVIAASLAAAACADPSEPPVSEDLPGEPSKADHSEFQLSGARGWYVVGNALTPGQDRLDLTITTTGDARVVDLWLDNRYVRRATRQGNKFTFSIDLKTVAVGSHRILLAADGARVAFAAVPFQRSHPLYIAVSNDWDDPDNADPMLERQERLHARHPHLVMTHFVGPYTFTDPAITPARRQRLVQWVTNLRDTEGDEIGLHVHPYCNFVRTAGVTCRTSPSFAYANGDTSGYTVILASYTRAELEKLFVRAADLFEQNGLGRPTSFRAGGWTADTNVLQALGTAGHVADSSGCNWSRLEEWADNSGAALYAWNRENWAAIDATSQPYYPSTTDILADAAPHIPVLEVPNNGLLVDYVSGAEMIDMFQQNWPERRPLAEPTVYAIGYHPPNFSETYFSRMDVALTEIDKYLALEGTGPVIYARMSDLKKVFPQP